jgi:hypothetical protein
MVPACDPADWANNYERRAAAVLRQSLADDIAVSHHSDQSVVVAYRDGADVTVSHQSCELGYGGFRTDPIDALMHRVFDFHGGASVA